MAQSVDAADDAAVGARQCCAHRRCVAACACGAELTGRRRRWGWLAGHLDRLLHISGQREPGGALVKQLATDRATRKAEVVIHAADSNAI